MDGMGLVIVIANCVFPPPMLPLVHAHLPCKNRPPPPPAMLTAGACANT